MAAVADPVVGVKNMLKFSLTRDTMHQNLWLKAIEELQADGLETTVAPNALFDEEYAEHATSVWHQTVDYAAADSVIETLHAMTGGRGPDACIDAVGMEAHGTGMAAAYDRIKQALRLETDRGDALRQAILSCRKGGVLSILGVYGVLDKFPMGLIMNKGLTVRSAQQHGQRYVPRLLSYVEQGQLDPSFLATHLMPLEDAVTGYDLFKHKSDECLRAVFIPPRATADGDLTATG